MKQKEDYCSFVNVFQGNGEIDLPEPQGIAAKWFFIKAGSGNTTPAATLPFGAMSVAPFSGGYPTGYGENKPNSHSRPPKFREGKKLLGFAHLQQSGTGAIGYYYNYAVVTPRYADSEERRLPVFQKGEPGYYACYLEDIFCELTASRNVAFHRYTFQSPNGHLVIDLKNNGLNIPGMNKAADARVTVKTIGQHRAVVKLLAEGVTLWFAFSSNGFLSANNEKLLVFMPYDTRGTLILRVSSSLKSESHALKFLNEKKSFENARQEAGEIWNRELSKIRIETDDDKIREIFYSNLYHSLVKPCDRDSESYFYEGGAFLTDFATLWDMYKTQLPLVLTINRDIGEKTVETLMRLCEALGHIPNTVGLSDAYKQHEGQARMLGDYVLLTAYRYGYPMNIKRLLKVIETDLFAEDKTDFTVAGKCRSATWFLDMAEVCALTGEIAREQGENSFAEKLFSLAKGWKSVYNKKTGLLTEDSSYYEGTLYNYSFRPMVLMEERMALAGGEENFVKLLDAFFGYGAPDVVLPTDYDDYTPVAEGMKLGRFEGFNNESDTEAPFSYIYANRHDRTAEIIRAGMKYMFTTGSGGLPGNNDSGALSSYYVWMALGLFPVAGQDLFLIASPFVDSAEVSLFNGNTLKITVNNNADENIYVKSVSFNGVPIKDYRIKASKLLKGGELIFQMVSKKE